jgi:Fe2+ or Zn2+ uptake regulation protein
MARLLLKLMCNEEAQTKSPTDWSADELLRELNGHGVPSDSETVLRVLDHFVAARIIVSTESAKYNLVHD